MKRDDFLKACQEAPAQKVRTADSAEAASHFFVALGVRREALVWRCPHPSDDRMALGLEEPVLGVGLFVGCEDCHQKFRFWKAAMKVLAVGRLP